MEEMHRVKYREKARVSRLTRHALSSPKDWCGSSAHSILWIFWRLHYTWSLGCWLIGHCIWTQPPVPFTYLEDRRWEDWKHQSFHYIIGFPGNQSSSSGVFPKATQFALSVPLTLFTFRKFQGFWKLWARDCRWRPNIWEIYKYF